MKLKITLKDTDGFYDGIREAVQSEVFDIEDLSDSERELVIERRHRETLDDLKQWVDCGEYVTLEFDTEAKTATVIEN